MGVKSRFLTDGGLNWWYLPPDPGGSMTVFDGEHQLPFYGEGLSTVKVTGGCGSGAPRPFELKTADISNLSGQSVRLRFSFFSDQYVERDGWYIDDAGIDVALFELEGDWVSPSITPHPVFGYGHLDGLAHEPANTSLRFSLLDSNGDIIPEYEQRILPFSVDLNPVEHPSVNIVVHMASDDPYLTPTVERLGLGVVQSFGRYHQKYNIEMSDFEVLQDGFLQATIGTTVDFVVSPGCVYDAVTFHQYGGNLSLYSFSFTQSSSQYYQGSPSVKIDQYNVNGEKELYAPWSFTLSSGEAFRSLVLEPRCIVPPQGPHVTVGQNQLVAIDWPPTGDDSNYGVQLQFDSLVNGTNIIDATQDGQLHVNTSASTAYQSSPHRPTNDRMGIANVCPLFEGSFTLQARSGSQQTDVYLGAGLLSSVPAIQPDTSPSKTPVQPLSPFRPILRTNGDGAMPFTTSLHRNQPNLQPTMSLPYQSRRNSSLDLMNRSSIKPQCIVHWR